MKHVPRFLVGVVAFALLAFTAQVATAHDDDEVTITGVASPSCLKAGEGWSVLWTILNHENENPFGIVDSEVNGSNVTFSPLVDDAAPGMYIPEGDSATVTTNHTAGTASAELVVTHDVTEGPDTEFDLTVARPAPCPEVDDESVTIRKTVLGVTNDPTETRVDVSGAVTDVTGLDETDAPSAHVRTLVAGAAFVLQENNIPSTHEFVAWECVSDQVGPSVATNNGDRSVTIIPRTGEDFVCTVSNQLKPPATATPAPTSTATPAPAPTSTPTINERIVEVQSDTYAFCPNGTIVNLTKGERCAAVVQAPAPTATPVPVSSGGFISPPRTGDGGLLNTILDPRVQFDPDTAAENQGQLWYWFTCFRSPWGGIFCY